MKRILVIAAAICLLSATATAQSPSPIIAHYRAYQAALERNDLAAAETSATEALAAAEAASDARAGALALNLATVRFLRGDARGALAPAQRALELAQQNPDAGLSPALANLLVARVELAQAAPDAAVRLHAALESAQSARLPAAEISDGAIELALWSANNERHDLALAGWTIADNFAEGSRYPEAYARARAKLGRAVAIVHEEVRVNGGDRFDAQNSTEALRQLYEASRLLQDVASQDLPSGDLTVAQQTYAEVRAWIAVVRSKIRADGLELPTFAVAQGDADGLAEDLAPPALLSRQRCWIQTGFIREIEYPAAADRRRELAGASVRLRINEAGEVEDATVVAIVGSQDFVEAINQARWRVTRRADSPPNCRMQMSIIRSIAFSLSPVESAPPARGSRRNSRP